MDPRHRHSHAQYPARAQADQGGVHPAIGLAMLPYRWTQLMFTQWAMLWGWDPNIGAPDWWNDAQQNNPYRDWGRSVAAQREASARREPFDPQR